MTQPRSIRDPRFTPVVELEPGALAEHPRSQAPPGFAYRRDPHPSIEQVIAAAGFQSLRPIQAGAWLFELAALDEPGLELVLDIDVFRHLEAEDGEGPEAILEASSSLSGGHILHDGALPLLKPGCCGALDTIAEWRAALDHRSASPLTVWNGHPWVDLRALEARDGSDRLELWQAGDGAPKDPAPYQIKRRALSEAIAAAAAILEAQLPRWTAALARRLPRLSEDEGERCARHLLGL